MIFSGLLLALIAAILLWAWRYPFPPDNFSATFRNGLSRAGFLIAAAVALLALRQVCAYSERCSGWTPPLSRLQPFLPLLLLLLFWLDVWTHEPQQNPTVPASIYTPGLARTKLAMQPQPALGESRAMVTPAAEVKFTQFIMSNPSDNFLVKRLGYFADCNLLDDVPKVNGFFSLYPRECGELASVLYGSTNADFPRLADFMSRLTNHGAGQSLRLGPAPLLPAARHRRPKTHFSRRHERPALADSAGFRWEPDCFPAARNARGWCPRPTRPAPACSRSGSGRSASIWKSKRRNPRWWCCRRRIIIRGARMWMAAHAAAAGQLCLSSARSARREAPGALGLRGPRVLCRNPAFGNFTGGLRRGLAANTPAGTLPGHSQIGLPGRLAAPDADGSASRRLGRPRSAARGLFLRLTPLRKGGYGARS